MKWGLGYNCNTFTWEIYICEPSQSNTLAFCAYAVATCTLYIYTCVYIYIYWLSMCCSTIEFYWSSQVKRHSSIGIFFIIHYLIRIAAKSAFSFGDTFWPIVRATGAHKLFPFGGSVLSFIFECKGKVIRIIEGLSGDRIGRELPREITALSTYSI